MQFSLSSISRFEPIERIERLMGREPRLCSKSPVELSIKLPIPAIDFPDKECAVIKRIGSLIAISALLLALISFTIFSIYPQYRFH